MSTIHPIYSQNVVIDGISVNTIAGRSTDGVAIDSSSGVMVENSSFSTGDDAIVIKSGRNKDGLRIDKPSENVVIRNCNISTAHAAVAIGSETSGGIKNIFVDNCNAENVSYGFRLKSAADRGGEISDIWVQNMNIHGTGFSAIEVNADYEKVDPSDFNLPSVHDIHFSGITGYGVRDAIYLNGFTDKPLDKITLENISLSSRKGIADINRSNNVTLDGINIQSNGSPLFYLNDSQNVTLENSICTTVNKCLEIDGENTKDIRLIKNNFDFKKIISGQDISPASLPIKKIIDLE